MAFDSFNRLTSTIAPDAGATATLYNAKDEPTRFTDAVEVQTNFVRKGFAEVIQEVSPDRGTSIYHSAMHATPRGVLFKCDHAPSHSAWTTLASNITYEPFAPMRSADHGSGLKLSQDWDSDRQLASKRLYTGSDSDICHVSYGYDN